MWLNVKAWSYSGEYFESGAYDTATAILTIDEQIKNYEAKPGLSPGLASALGLTAGPSFHFVLNDTLYKDNRIPPRGFTNAGFDSVQAAPVGYSYADGEYWDDTHYELGFEGDFAAKLFDNLITDHETQAYAIFVYILLIDETKKLEEFGLVLLFDTESCILHFDLN